MAKNKLKRYGEIVEFKNVTDLSELRPGMEADLRGRWAAEIFGNPKPVTLELACGKGDYAVNLARLFPERNFIGIDIKGERLWVGSGTAQEQGLENVHFIRGRINFLPAIFATGEIDEIWITFPDPFLSNRRRTRRLTHPLFLDRYRQVLRPGGLIRLKTDSPELYAFTLETIASEGHEIIERIDDVYALPEVPELLRIRTYYENMHLEEGRTIRYVSFTLRS